MNVKDIKQGIHVRVHTLGSTAGMLISPGYLALRREGATGWIREPVPGDGDLWWVEHSDRIGETTAYSFHEFEPAPEPARALEQGSILD